MYMPSSDVASGVDQRLVLVHRFPCHGVECNCSNLDNTVCLAEAGKSAVDYWTGINRALVNSLGSDIDLWKAEKIASQESLAIVKEESVRYLTVERDRLLSLSHQEALNELVQMAGFNSRIQKVERIQHGPLLRVG